jgi:Putative transmembrane protein (PGPGW)
MTARRFSSAMPSAVAGAPGTSGAGMTAPLWRWARKSGVTVAGVAMLAGGAVMLVLPGPGLAVIALGLAVLSSEYAWAARLLAGARQFAVQIGSHLRSRWRGGRS